jgi:hypothetical protein
MKSLDSTLTRSRCGVRSVGGESIGFLGGFLRGGHHRKEAHSFVVLELVGIIGLEERDNPEGRGQDARHLR